ncbi:MAG: hypothetical protein U1F42_09640 [Candidatus Competibacteraceae bacterium]
MTNDFKQLLLAELESLCGGFRKLPGSQSLIEFATGERIYLRYSKIHGKGAAFFGLRLVDLNLLDGHSSFICFFDDKGASFFIPHEDFEAVIRQSPLASDGQFKAQIIYRKDSCDLYLPRVGYFNINAYSGVEYLAFTIHRDKKKIITGLSHSQAQTLIGGIGHLKGYTVYVPPNNIELLDWTLTQHYQIVPSLPGYIEERARFASEIDVIWIEHKQNFIAAAFEIEHSTPVYSGLLRFNDVLLTCPGVSRFFVVSNETRRDLFARQMQRPTFERSGLNELTSFLDYTNVFNWHSRLMRKE